MKTLLAAAVAAIAAFSIYFTITRDEAPAPDESRQSSGPRRTDPAPVTMDPPGEMVRSPVAAEGALPDGHDDLRPADEPTVPALTDADVDLIKRNLHQLYADADLESVVAGLRDVRDRYPVERINALHDAKLAAGDYQPIDAPKAEPGKPVSVPQVPPSRKAFGLVMVHKLDDGSFVKTDLDLSELGADAQVAVEYGALQEIYGEVGRKRPVR